MVEGGYYLYSTGVVGKIILKIQDPFFEKKTIEEALKDQAVKDWDYTTDQATANVISTDIENGTLVLSFVWPPDFINSKFGEERPVPEETVEITCPKEESYLYFTRVVGKQQTTNPEDFQQIGSGIDIVAEAQSGDSLLGYCATEECEEINRECVLLRTVFAEE